MYVYRLWAGFVYMLSLALQTEDCSNAITNSWRHPGSVSAVWYDGRMLGSWCWSSSISFLRAGKDRGPATGTTDTSDTRHNPAIDTRADLLTSHRGPAAHTVLIMSGTRTIWTLTSIKNILPGVRVSILLANLYWTIVDLVILRRRRNFWTLNHLCEFNIFRPNRSVWEILTITIKFICITVPFKPHNQRSFRWN